MQRPPKAPSRDAFKTDAERSAYDRVYGHRASIGHEIGPYFAALLHIPEIAEPLTALGSLWRQSEARGSISNKAREFVSIAVGAQLGCFYVVKNHWPAAKAAGVSPEVLKTLLGAGTSPLPDEERAIADKIDKVLTGRVADEDYRELAAAGGDRCAVELLTFVAYVLFSVRAIQALGIPQPSREEVLQSI